jgi:hypothetical protein
MIHVINSAATFLAALCSAIAAYFWHRASQVEAPEVLRGTAPIGGSVRVNTNPLVAFARETGRRNKVAAKWSAAAAAFAFLSWALSLF